VRVGPRSGRRPEVRRRRANSGDVVDRQDLALAVLSALIRQPEPAHDDAGGWTLPITVALAIGSTTEAVLNEFQVLADRGEIELKELSGGIATMGRISVKGKTRLTRLAQAKRAAALRPHAGAEKARPEFRYDVFVSHASEDADPFADTLVAELQQRRLRVWYDGERMGHGSAMIEKINDGLRSSRCGVIVASPHYFQKTYTKPELSALINALLRDDARKLLPVLYQMSQEELFAVHPLLANLINIDAAEHDPAEIARMVAAAVAPQAVVRPVFFPWFYLEDSLHPLGMSFFPRMQTVPFDALPDQPHLLAVRPLIQIAWYEPEERNGHPTIAWRLSNVGVGEARDVAVFLPGIAAYAAGVLAVAESKDERRRFDDRYAYYEIMKPPIQAIVEFADVHGNVYREYAEVKASFKLHDDPAKYVTTMFGSPYPVSRRIVQPDVDRDRFFLTGPTWNADAASGAWNVFGF
jgi:TIR domain